MAVGPPKHTFPRIPVFLSPGIYRNPNVNPPQKLAYIPLRCGSTAETLRVLSGKYSIVSRQAHGNWYNRGVWRNRKGAEKVKLPGSPQSFRGRFLNILSQKVPLRYAVFKNGLLGPWVYTYQRLDQLESVQQGLRLAVGHVAVQVLFRDILSILRSAHPSALLDHMFLHYLQPREWTDIYDGLDDPLPRYNRAVTMYEERTRNGKLEDCFEDEETVDCNDPNNRPDPIEKLQALGFF